MGYRTKDEVQREIDALGGKPTYASQWQPQIDDTLNRILNREKFSYDVNGDALYKQYKDKYTQQGKMAMQDTVAQASAMTGGYGNSYAVTAGNQAYQSSLQNLNDVIPELYALAYDKYNQEGQELYNQYSLFSDRENTEYGRYRDSVSDWESDRSYLTSLYNDAPEDEDYWYDEYENAAALGTDAVDALRQKMKESGLYTDERINAWLSQFESSYTQANAANAPSTGMDSYNAYYDEYKGAVLSGDTTFDSLRGRMKAAGYTDEQINGWLTSFASDYAEENKVTPIFASDSDLSELYGFYRTAWQGGEQKLGEFRDYLSDTYGQQAAQNYMAQFDTQMRQDMLPDFFSQFVEANNANDADAFAAVEDAMREMGYSDAQIEELGAMSIRADLDDNEEYVMESFTKTDEPLSTEKYEEYQGLFAAETTVEGAIRLRDRIADEGHESDAFELYEEWENSQKSQ